MRVYTHTDASGMQDLGFVGETEAIMSTNPCTTYAEQLGPLRHEPVARPVIIIEQ